MNVLKDKAIWKSNAELPSESGIYLTFSTTNGLHQWIFQADRGYWGNGVYIPGKQFDWLNVRINMGQYAKQPITALDGIPPQVS